MKTAVEQRTKAVGYIRVSTDEQARNGLSLAGQRERILAYAALRQLELVDVIADAGVSGSVPLSDRPGGGRVAELVKRGEVGAIVLVRLDRGFRSTVDCLETVKAWDRRSVGVHVLDLGGNAVDTQSASGRFMLTVLAAIGEMERGQILERCNEGRRQARKNGKPLSKAVPYGFKRKDARLIPDPKEQKNVRYMRDLKASGTSLRAIAAKLNKRGIRTKAGRDWKAVQVSRALRAAELRPTAVT